MHPVLQQMTGFFKIVQQKKEPSIGVSATATKLFTIDTTVCDHEEFMGELQEEQAWCNLLMGNVMDLEEH